MRRPAAVTMNHQGETSISKTTAIIHVCVSVCLCVCLHRTQTVWIEPSQRQYTHTSKQNLPSEILQRTHTHTHAQLHKHPPQTNTPMLAQTHTHEPTHIYNQIHKHLYKTHMHTHTHTHTPPIPTGSQTRINLAFLRFSEVRSHPWAPPSSRFICSITDSGKKMTQRHFNLPKIHQNATDSSSETKKKKASTGGDLIFIFRLWNLQWRSKFALLKQN